MVHDQKKILYMKTFLRGMVLGGYSFFAQVGSDIVGKWLGVWIVAASAISSIGMFESEMSSDSFQLMGMAERGMLPAVFAHRSRYGTPTLGILLSAGGILGLVLLSFMEIIELLNFLYCLSQFIEFAAFIKLRMSQPHLHRPYRIPLGTVGCVVMLLPPVAMLSYILYMAALKTWLISLIFLAVGTGLYWLLMNNRVRGECDNWHRVCSRTKKYSSRQQRLFLQLTIWLDYRLLRLPSRSSRRRRRGRDK
jgi:amino acid transporter